MTDDTLEIRKMLFWGGLVFIKNSDISDENRKQLVISDDNILDHHGLCCGVSDSAIPQLAQRWQH